MSAKGELLKQLEGKWHTVKLQTNWGLEPVFCFNDVDKPDQPAPSTSLSQSQPQLLAQDESDSSIPENVATSPQQSDEDNAPPPSQD